MSFGTFLQLLTTFLLSNALGHRESWALLALGPLAINTLGPGAVFFGKAVRGSLGWRSGAGPCQWQTNPAGCVVCVHVVPAGLHSLIKTMLLFPNKYVSLRPAPAHLSRMWSPQLIQGQAASCFVYSSVKLCCSPGLWPHHAPLSPVLFTRG